MRSGAVNAPKNGNTAPILSTSAEDASIITKNKSPNCARRRGLMCHHRRRKSFNRDELAMFITYLNTGEERS